MRISKTSRPVGIMEPKYVASHNQQTSWRMIIRRFRSDQFLIALQLSSKPPPRRTTSAKCAGGGSVRSGRTSYTESRTENATDIVALTPREEVSWTALIVRLNKCGQPRQALQVFKDMLQSGVSPSTYTLVAALKACSKLKDLESVRGIHVDVVRGGLESSLVLGNVLVDVYCKCGCVSNARHVFENMRQRNVISWTAMIMGYAHMGEGEEALQLYKQMEQEGAVPNDRTFVGALLACSSIAASVRKNKGCMDDVRKWCLEYVRGIHTNIQKLGYESDVFVGTSLVDAYAKCGWLLDARHVFKNMPHRNVISWNTMISCCSHLKAGEEALQLYQQMRKEGFVPNERTYVAVLKACSVLASMEGLSKRDERQVRERLLQTVRAVHLDVMKSGSESAASVRTMLVDVYAKLGSLVDARHVFHSTPHPSLDCWNAMILGCAEMEEAEEALQLYAQMQQQGVIQDGRIFVATLKACRSLVSSGARRTADRNSVHNYCLQQVRIIHEGAVKAGCVSDEFVQNILVDVYAKCGSLGEARHVFDKMLGRSVVSWTSMILGYAQLQEGEMALQLFAQMQEEGVLPDGPAFISALKACHSLAAFEENTQGNGVHVKKRTLEQVRAIHSQIVKIRCELSICVGTMLVDAYVKCGSLLDAKRVFETMPHRNEVSWSAIIFGHAQTHQGKKALQLYEEMLQEGVTPDDRAIVGALKACISLLALEDGKEVDGVLLQKQCLEQIRIIHSHILKRGSDIQVFVGTTLVDAYAKCGSLAEAMSIFEALPCRDAACWTAMIVGYAEGGEGELGIELYEQMQQQGVTADAQALVGALKACSSLAAMEEMHQGDTVCFKEKALGKARTIHSDAVNRRLESDIFVGNSLVDVYVKCGSLMDARRVFENLPHKDVVSWNIIISGYAQAEECEAALQLYLQMQNSGVLAGAQAFVGALKACISLATREVLNNSSTLSVKKRVLELVRGIHSTIVSSKCDSNMFVATTLIDAYAKCGNIADARRVFEAMSHRDATSWGAMIFGYAQMDEAEVALQLYARMEEEAVVPDHRSLIGALTACGSASRLEKGREIHAQLSAIQLAASDLHVASSLIDMYSKCGSMPDAQLAFDMLPRRDVVTWNALIAGYVRQGDSGLVFELFEQMKQEQVWPDETTLLNVLTVCSHAGLVDKGQKYFEALSREFNITPTLQHYSCMIDLLGRAGHVDRAMVLAKTMPFQPDISVWRSILGASQKWCAVALGREAFELAARLDRIDTAACVLMSNIFAAAGMQEEARTVQAIMNEQIHGEEAA